MARLPRMRARRAHAPGVAVVLGATMLLGAPSAALGGEQTQYVVVAERGAATADVTRAITAAGGTITSRNNAIGTFSVLASTEGFSRRCRPRA